MPKIINITGQRFGYFIVLEKTDHRLDGSVVWKCKCDCGKIFYTSTKNIGKGQKSNCGCKTSYLKSSGTRKEIFVAAYNRLYRDYLNAAKKRNLEFNISLEEFKLITSLPCHYCGNAPKKHFRNLPYNVNGIPTTNGIDRIDNNLGYTIENCVPCCKICNVAKAQMTKQEFINHISKIYNHLHQ